MKVFALIVAIALAPCSVLVAANTANVESIFADQNEAIQPTLPPAVSMPPAKGVSEGSYKKISMVIETLKDILQSVKDEESQQSKNQQDFSTWCGKETQSVGEDLKHTKDDLQEANAHSEELESIITTLKANIAKDAKELEETKDAIAQATNLRHSENEEYTEDMMLNTQSRRQIDDAIKHVSSIDQQGGFLQNGALRSLRINQPGDSSYVLGIMKGLKDKLSKTRNALETT
jgi:DNA repair exonuclease SbcCD ATPase subunit